MPAVGLFYVGLVTTLLGAASLLRPLAFLGIGTRRAGAFVLGAGLAVGAIGLSLPAREVRIGAARTRLDEFAPVYQFLAGDLSGKRADPADVAARREAASGVGRFVTSPCHAFLSTRLSRTKRPAMGAGPVHGEERMRFVTVVPIALLLTGAVVLALRAPQPLAAPPSQPAGAAAHQESPLACNVTALTPEERKRHFDELGPNLRELRMGVRELPDGYELEFPADTATYRLLTEWAAGERVCCPFFDIDVRSAREGGPVRLRLTGRKGVKQFIEVDGADWVKK